MTDADIKKLTSIMDSTGKLSRLFWVSPANQFHLIERLDANHQRARFVQGGYVCYGVTDLQSFALVTQLGQD